MPDLPLAALALLHGGVHTARCWDQTIAAIGELDGGIDMVAPSLPGRDGVAGDLATLTIDECAHSVARQIRSFLDTTRDRKVTLIGHSLAGVVLPQVVSDLGADYVAQVIFVACCVPPPDQSVLDTLPFGLKGITRRLVRRSPIVEMPEIVLRRFFGNGATPSQIEAIRSHACPESSALLTEVPQARLPRTVPTAWIVPSRDRALRPSTQRRFMAALGGVDVVMTIDAGHEMMLTHPRELAEAIVSLVRPVP